MMATQGLVCVALVAVLCDGAERRGLPGVLAVPSVTAAHRAEET